MRIISRNILISFWKKYPDSVQTLKAWFDEVRNAGWRSPNELKEQYRNASVISSKRVVFNIKGNSYRLIADIEYKIGILFIVWVGTHEEYNKISVEEVKYDKAN